MAEPATARIPINFELGEKAYRQRDGPRHDVSSQSRTKLSVPAGTPDHCRGGERFFPSQVNRRGIAAPSSKALETSFIARSIRLQEVSARA